MKRILFTLVVGALMALPALANPTYRPTHSDLLSATEIYDPGSDDSLAGATDILANYDGQTSMLGQVGYWGKIVVNDEIWVGGTGVDLTGYDDFALMLHNDDDDQWAVRLFAMPDGTPGSAVYSGGFVTLSENESVNLSLDLAGNSMDTTGRSIGVVIKNAKGQTDWYHISATVPAPGAVLLGSIGIGFVGWLRRKTLL